jgi:VanZ family protein
MDLLSRRRVRSIAILAAAILLYWLAMFAATHLPFQTTPKGDPYSLDKLQHITAFAVFAVLLCFAGSKWGLSHLPLYLGVIALIAAYAALDEISQRFVPERTPDLFDWVADVCGAVVGIIAFVTLQRIAASRQLAKPPAT